MHINEFSGEEKSWLKNWKKGSARIMSEYKNSFDKVKNDIVDQAFADSDNRLNDKAWNETQPHEFSDRHQKNMESFFEEFESKTAKSTKSSFAWYKIVACILGFIIVGSSVTIASVDAFRESFLNFVFEKDQPNTDFNFGENEGTRYSDDVILLGYVPVGFEVTRSENYGVQSFWMFNNNDKFFQITASDHVVDLSIDTEDGYAENIILQNTEAIFISNDNINSVVYEVDGKSIVIAGNINKEELIKIANKFSFK